MTREEALELLILNALRQSLPKLKGVKKCALSFKVGTEKAVFVWEWDKKVARFTNAQEALDYVVGRLMQP